MTPDPATVFRAEALEHRARPPAATTVLAAAPRWLGAAYWCVLIAFVGLGGAAFVVRVPRDVRARATVGVDTDGSLHAWTTVPDDEARLVTAGAAAWLEVGAERVPLVVDAVELPDGAAGTGVVRAHGVAPRGGTSRSVRGASLVVRVGRPRLIVLLLPALGRMLGDRGNGS